MKIGDLIFCRGEYWGIILQVAGGFSCNDWMGALPEWVEIFWNTGLTTWEEVEPSFEDPEVMQVLNESG